MIGIVSPEPPAQPHCAIREVHGVFGLPRDDVLVRREAARSKFDAYIWSANDVLLGHFEVRLRFRVRNVRILRMLDSGRAE